MANKKVSELPPVNTLSDTDIFVLDHAGSTGTVNFSTMASTISGNSIPKPTGLDSINNGNVLTYQHSTTSWIASAANYIRKPTGGILGDSLVKNSDGEWVPKSTTSLISQTTLNQGVVVAKGYFKLISLVTDSAINVPTFLNVTVNRTSGDQYVTVNYSGLPPKYKSLTDPFFVNGQYIGISTVSGKMTGHLYMIEDHNPTACTFKIDTIGATGAMVNQSAQLTIALNNVDNDVLDAYNIKSVFFDITAHSKFYVNFKQDLYTGSKTNTTPTEILSMLIFGQGYVSGRNLTWPVMLFNANRNNPATKETYEYHQDVGEGFGANSMGVHVGFFYGYNNGQGANTMSNAIFACVV